MQGKDCAELIKRIHCAIKKKADNELREEDLTCAQVYLLFILQREPEGQCLLKTLEKRMGVAQSTMAGLVRRSEEKGFVEYIEDPADRRVRLARITEKGLQVCRDTDDKIRRSEARMVSLLTEEEADLLSELLRKVYTAVSSPE